MDADSVSLGEVREWTAIAFDLLEKGGVTHLRLEPDLRWQVFFAEAFKQETKPEFVIGSVRDDVDELREITRELHNGEGEAVWHYVQHLAGLFVALAAQAGDESLFVELGEAD